MKRPKLQTVVAVVQILSALAVVGSLLYAVYEFKRSATLNSRDVENILYQRMLEMDRLVIEHPEFAEVLSKATGQPDGLTPEERTRFAAYSHILFDSWEVAWGYSQEGILEADAWRGWNDWFLAEAKRRPLLAWTDNRKNFSGEFLDYVDRELLGGAYIQGSSAVGP